jgi:hypothetical protein
MITERAAPYHAMEEACRSKASRAVSVSDRTDWLSLADAWLQLVHEAEEAGELGTIRNTVSFPQVGH